MDMQNVGGTPGGMKSFLLGLIMIAVGGYLLMNQVDVHGGYWRFNFMGSYGQSFGITLIPLLFGIGILFFDAVRLSTSAEADGRKPAQRRKRAGAVA